MIDAAVRQSNADTAMELLPRIPSSIEGSTARTSPENLRWMMERVIAERDQWPVDKMGRWIGFVQGVLALSGNLDVDEERERTRARMHDAYRVTGQAIPDTAEMPAR